MDAPVADPFRPPPQPWLPGNRGIEFRTVAGQPVVAIGPGTVRWVGTVAGRTIITVDHAGGLRSSYVGVIEPQVQEGRTVRVGDLLARARERFHLGVRWGDRYLDPAALWGRPFGAGRAVLVPVGRRSPWGR